MAQRFIDPFSAKVLRVARRQRDEFANRSMADHFTADRKRKQALESLRPPTELQRAAEAPPPWQSCRLPSKLARASLLHAKRHANLTKGKASDRTESGSNTDVRQSARSDSPQLRPSLEALLEMVDCDGRRATAEERRSARLPETQGGRALRTVSAQEAASGSRRVSKCPWLCKRADALEGTLVGNSHGQARQTHSAYLAEQTVIDTSKPVVLRCFAFWRCLEAWRR